MLNLVGALGAGEGASWLGGQWGHSKAPELGVRVRGGEAGEEERTGTLSPGSSGLAQAQGRDHWAPGHHHGPPLPPQILSIAQQSGRQPKSQLKESWAANQETINVLTPALSLADPRLVPLSQLLPPVKWAPE